MSDNTFYYTFTHKSGRKVIAQSWAEFYRLQQNPDYNSMWQRQYYKLGVRSDRFVVMLPAKGGYKSENIRNNFWKACEGYEKSSKVDCIGVTGCLLRMINKEVHNHACMIGDVETVKKCKEYDAQYHQYGSISRLTLPMPK